MPSASIAPGVALLVDLDNLSVGSAGTGTKGATPAAIAQALQVAAERFGSVTVARVYSSIPRNIAVLDAAFGSRGYEVKPALLPRANPDISMALDGQALLFTAKDIETYVIASGDSDFAPLADSILAAHKHLVVVAPTLVTSGVIKAKAREFIALEELIAKAAKPPTQYLRLPLLKAFETPPQAHRPMLRVFLCHSKHDKPTVRKLYERLRDEEGIKPWLDETDLLAGQNWEMEITKEVRNSHCVLVCLSKKAIGADGFVHKEIKFALDVNDRKPEGTIYLIPVKFEECEVPERISQFHWVDLFEPSGYANLMRSLRQRANGIEQAP